MTTHLLYDTYDHPQRYCYVTHMTTHSATVMSHIWPPAALLLCHTCDHPQCYCYVTRVTTRSAIVTRVTFCHTCLRKYLFWQLSGSANAAYHQPRPGFSHSAAAPVRVPGPMVGQHPQQHAYNSQPQQQHNTSGMLYLVYVYNWFKCIYLWLHVDKNEIQDMSKICVLCLHWSGLYAYHVSIRLMWSHLPSEVRLLCNRWWWLVWTGVHPLVADL